MTQGNSEIIFDRLLPPTKEGVEKFLASQYIKGIGKVFASEIVEKVGFRILENDFDFKNELKGIDGLGDAKIEVLIESFSNLKYSPGILGVLFSSGLSDTEVDKITSHYRKNTERVISEDPYQMVEEVFKLSFFTADKIGKFIGIADDDKRRIRGALLTAVKISAEHGNMFAMEEEAVATASRILKVDKVKVAAEIEPLIRDERLVRSHEGLYLPVYYKAEKECALKLSEIVRNNKPDCSEFAIIKFDVQGNKFSEKQLEAIETVRNNSVTIITGGPGTGKTTAIRGIINLFEDLDKKVILAAPTGRAAKRLSELAGKEAMTLHRLLGYSQGRGYRNKHLDADLLIIDEASMLEQVMFNHLLQAVDPSSKIVLVGDTDQLPSIGAGNVLKDMISSGTIPVVFLKENFRQKEGSGIAENAASIKAGESPAQSFSDFMIISEEGQKKIHDRLLNLVAEELPQKLHVKSNNIQVVTPQQEGPLGAKQLNLDIQERVNPCAPELKRGLKRFRLGDRVMQTSNSSVRHIYNGETGWISEVDSEGSWLEVTFNDGKKSRYSNKELGELSLAYATSVHKLQGSETDYMVMPMTMSHKPMLYRNILYTGISRARKMCVLVGEQKAIQTAVDNPSPAIRNSNFNKRLRENLPVVCNN